MTVNLAHEVGLGREADRRAVRSSAGEGAAAGTVLLAAPSPSSLRVSTSPTKRER